MVEIALSGALGAAILAIVLLHQQVRTNTRRITDLSAQLAAVRIRALPASRGSDDHPESPAGHDAKNHLTLLHGGSVALFCATRDAVRQGPATRIATTAIAAAAVAVVGTAYLGTLDGAPRRPQPARPSLATPLFGTGTSFYPAPVAPAGRLSPAGGVALPGADPGLQYHHAPPDTPTFVQVCLGPELELRAARECAGPGQPSHPSL